MVGVLADRLQHEPEDSVRRSVIRSLNEIDTKESRAALEAGRADERLRAQIDDALKPERVAAEEPEKQSPQKLNDDDTPDFQQPFALRPAEEKKAPLVPEQKEKPAVVIPPPAPEPELPFSERDGLPLAITTSALSGATLFPYLAALAEQKNALTLTLTGTAGAVIGGGSTWGLSRFGLRPKLGQAVWFSNATVWGTLSGLSLYSGLVSNSGMDSAGKDKALWGLLAGGQTLGMAAGALSAKRWDWSPGQIGLANGFVAGSWVTYAGARLLNDQSLEMNAPVAIATIPVMVGSAVAARYVDPTQNDAQLIVASTAASAFAGALIAGGTAPDYGAEGRTLGGAMVGLGAGLLASSAASAFTEVDPRRSWHSLAYFGMGGAAGFGTAMLLRPVNGAETVDGRPWLLGAAAGGIAFGTAAFAAYPYLEYGERAPSMATAGVLYGSGTWLLASLAGDDGVRRASDEPTVVGGMIAGSAVLGTAGLLSSRWFSPDGWDQGVTAGSTVLTASTGLGLVRLLRPDPSQKGGVDSLGVLGGAALGFAGGALVQHLSALDEADVGAGALGMGVGALSGALIPTLGNPEWYRDGDGRQQRILEGGTLLGFGLGGLSAATAAHLSDVSASKVKLSAVGSLLGLSMGTGLGIAIEPSTSRGGRVGAVSGTLLGGAASLALDPWLRFSDGVPSSAGSLATLGAALGASYGLVAAELPSDRNGARYFGASLFGAPRGSPPAFCSRSGWSWI